MKEVSLLLVESLLVICTPKTCAMTLFFISHGCFVTRLKEWKDAEIFVTAWSREEFREKGVSLECISHTLTYLLPYITFFESRTPNLEE